MTWYESAWKILNRINLYLGIKKLTINNSYFTGYTLSFKDESNPSQSYDNIWQAVSMGNSCEDAIMITFYTVKDGVESFGALVKTKEGWIIPIKNKEIYQLASEKPLSL